MSQSSSHVEWCLKKAQKEIIESEKLGKKPKHRGLMKSEPNFEESKKHVEKAKHNLEVTEYLIEGGFTDVSVGTIFYSMYQCFLAISLAFGYESGNQTCTIALIQHLKEKGKIKLDDKFINYFKYDESNNIIGMREDYTYGAEIKADKTRVNFLIKESKELLDITKEIIYKQT